MILYQHTLFKKPAEFNGIKLVLSCKGRGYRYPLATSLNQIRREQKISIQYRKNVFGDYKPEDHFDYVIIETPKNE